MRATEARLPEQATGPEPACGAIRCGICDLLHAPMLTRQFVSHVTLRRDTVAAFDAYPFSLPAVRARSIRWSCIPRSRSSSERTVQANPRSWRRLPWRLASTPRVGRATSISAPTYRTPSCTRICALPGLSQAAHRVLPARREFLQRGHEYPADGWGAGPWRARDRFLRRPIAACAIAWGIVSRAADEPVRPQRPVPAR